MDTGKFITFEGGEGAGKSTQAAMLAERLRETGRNVVETREPGGTERAEAIRSFLLSGGAKEFGPLGEAVLFSSARDDHVREIIRPALDHGTWVLCDRFSDSTTAYQGAAGGVSPTIIRALHRVAVGNAVPDLTVILDVPAQAGLQRAHQRASEEGDEPLSDHFEGQTLRFHEALRGCFLQIAKEEPDRCIVIDAQLPAETVAEDVWDAVTERLVP